MSSTRLLVLAQYLLCSLGWRLGGLQRICTRPLPQRQLVMSGQTGCSWHPLTACRHQLQQHEAEAEREPAMGQRWEAATVPHCLQVQEAMVDVHWGEDVTSKGPCKTQVGPSGQLVFLGWVPLSKLPCGSCWGAPLHARLDMSAPNPWQLTWRASWRGLHAACPVQG